MKRRVVVATPRYAALAVPTADPLPWPPGAVGWTHYRWVLRNESSQSIKLYKLDWVPWKGDAGRAPVVDEPAGNQLVQVSFDALAIATGQSTRITVSVNPAAKPPTGDQLEFEWTVAEGHSSFAVFVDGAGQPTRGVTWSNAWVVTPRITIDHAAKTIRFTGPT